MATGTIMLADAVFEAASDMMMPTAVKTIVSDSAVFAGRGRNSPSHRFGEPGRKRQFSHRQAAAEEENDSPVDSNGLLPAQRELPSAPVHRQQKEQNRARHRSNRLRHRRGIGAVECAAAGADDGKDAGQQPQKHRRGKRDEHIALSRREWTQSLQFIVDESGTAGIDAKVPQRAEIKIDNEVAEEEHHDRNGKKHPLKERDLDPRDAIQHADPDQVRWSADRCTYTSD
jgi:hypothetical protein